MPLINRNGFDDADDLLTSTNDEYLIEMRSQLTKMRRRLANDMEKGYINQDKFNNMAAGFYRLTQATVECNAVELYKVNAELKYECFYKNKVFTKYTAIGALAGAFLVGVGCAISVLSSGLGMPLGAWLANVGSSMLLGAIGGSKLPQYQAKRAIDNLTSTAENHLKSKNVEVAPSVFTTFMRSFGFFRTIPAPSQQEPLLPVRANVQAVQH